MKKDKKYWVDHYKGGWSNNVDIYKIKRIYLNFCECYTRRSANKICKLLNEAAEEKEAER